jgi:hypothetical protein
MLLRTVSKYPFLPYLLAPLFKSLIIPFFGVICHMRDSFLNIGWAAFTKCAVDQKLSISFTFDLHQFIYFYILLSSTWLTAGFVTSHKHDGLRRKNRILQMDY